MISLPITELNTLRFNEAITGRILLYVEHGAVKGNYVVPEDHIVGSVPALLELADRASVIKHDLPTADVDNSYTGRVVTYYEKGREVSSEALQDNLHIASLPDLIELLIDAGYRVTRI